MDKKILAAALITPLMLLSNPVVCETASPSYSHATQTTQPNVQQNASDGNRWGGPGTHTWNATQTFGANGQPSDSDADSDEY
jgi:hypothetical protein